MRRALWVLVLVGCAPDVREALDSSPDACASCHPAEVESWRKSRHAQAFVDPVFQAQFNPKRWAWCVQCHAPSAPDPTQVKEQDPLASQGVGCLSCHLRDGVLVSRSKSARSPHQTKVQPSFGDPSFCGGCHDFNFPVLGEDGRQERPTTLPMQETLRQYQKSTLSQIVECIDCHEAHTFFGATDPTMLAEALSVSGCKEGGVLYLELSNIGAAHHIPTGGIDRHLWLKVWRSGAPEGFHKAFIGRRFRPIEGDGKEVISDTTIPPGESRWFFVEAAALRGETNEPIQIFLEYVAGPEKEKKRFAISWDVLETTLQEKELPVCTAPRSNEIQLSPPRDRKKR